MFGRTIREAAHKRADKALDAAVGFVVQAKEAVVVAAQHAQDAIDHHEAEIAYHRTRHTNAVNLLGEAQSLAKDVGKVLGDDEPATTAETVATDGG